MSNRKVCYNRCFGGFGLSEAALTILRGIGVMSYKSYSDDELFDQYSIPRHHPDLIRVVEMLGTKDASAIYADLGIYDLGDSNRYRIDEYDGQETVIEPSGYDWIIIND